MSACQSQPIDRPIPANRKRLPDQPNGPGLKAAFPPAFSLHSLTQLPTSTISTERGRSTQGVNLPGPDQGWQKANLAVWKGPDQGWQKANLAVWKGPDQGWHKAKLAGEGKDRTRTSQAQHVPGQRTLTTDSLDQERELCQDSNTHRCISHTRPPCKEEVTPVFPMAITF
ncbi:hypothetical protein ACOMHN_028015 [Nucella lapillus]